MIPPRLALPLENLLNRNLEASLTARRAAADVEGLCTDVGLSASEPLMRMRVEGGRLRLGEPDDAPAAVTLAGDWSRLLALLGGDHTAPGLDLRGDPAVAEGFARLLKHCRPGPGRRTGPPHRACSCPPGQRCRFRSGTVARTRGRIAQAQYAGFPSGGGPVVAHAGGV